MPTQNVGVIAGLLVLALGIEAGCRSSEVVVADAAPDAMALPDLSMEREPLADQGLADGVQDASSSGDANSSSLPDGGGSVSAVIGQWTDEPGACPAGAARVDITTVGQMEEASRGEAHAEATCFFVHDGEYEQRGSTLPLYFRRGGSAGAPILWVGQSRGGVVIRGRATFEADDIVMSNMTFDLTGYSQSGAFSTVTVLADRITMSHVTLTGDCETGLRGGQIEIADGASSVLVEACLVERFGQCNGDGHLDHGIYLAAGHDLTLRNNVIRGNSSRGIQLNTQGGEYGTLDAVTVENNRIYENGHRDYEDGMVINGSGTGTIANVAIRHNLFYRNYYAAIRFSGDAISQVLIEKNTFFRDGAASGGGNRSAINLDDATPEVTARRNIFAVERTVINVCANAVAVEDNVVVGDASGSCVDSTVVADPGFADVDADDYHPTNAAVAGYGAYAP